MFCDVKKVNIIAIQKRGLVEKDSNEIVDIVAFNKYNDENTELAKTKYGVTNPGKLYNTTRTEVKLQHGNSNSRDNIKTVHRYFQNQEFFNELQEKHNQRNQESNVKPGVSELFNSNSELANEVYEALGFETFTEDQKKNVRNMESDINNGWKLHLSIKGVESFESTEDSTPSKEIEKRAVNTISILNDLRSKKLIQDYKIGNDGGQPGKNITVYIGSSTKVDSVVNSLINDELRDSEIQGNLKLSKGISARFDSHRQDLKIDNDTYTLFRYGVNGIPNIKYGSSGANQYNSQEVPYSLELFQAVLGSYFNSSSIINSSLNKIYPNTIGNTQITPQQKQQAQQKFQEYVDTTGKQDIKGFKEFTSKQDDGDFYQTSTPKVDYNLKAVSLVTNSLAKVKSWFKQIGNNDTFWNKIQKDLGIPKEQVELLRNSEGNTVEEKLVDFAAKYSYPVEINTAKTIDNIMGDRFENFSYDGGVWINSTTGRDATEEELQYINKNQKRQGTPTQYHSNLTVPGGTNYTENALRTPGIQNYKSAGGGYHDNEFNESRGDMIGWFRSDEQVLNGKPEVNIEIGESGIEYEHPMFPTKGTIGGEATKTRRVLEMQSFFQKVRDTNFLVSKSIVNQKDRQIAEDLYGRSDEENKELYTEREQIIQRLLNSNDNKFLQLLNKDNNWVTFFVKSIIQDSAKKGYEKVLFPTGETAAKVEGHQTLANDIKKLSNENIELNNKIESFTSAIEINESRIKNAANSSIAKLKVNKLIRGYGKPVKVLMSNGYVFTTEFKSSRGLSNSIDIYRNNNFIVNIKANTYSELNEKLVPALEKKYSKPITEYKEKIENAGKAIQANLKKIKQNEIAITTLKTEGIEKLKPIEAFYGNTVTNILKKQGLSSKVITDEYGNTWNEVEIKPEHSNEISLQTKSETKEQVNERINTKLKNFLLKQGISLEYLDKITDEFGGNINAVFNSVKKTIKVAKGEEKLDTLPEEVGHAITRGLGKNHLLVKKLFNLIKRTDYKSKLDPRYVELYKGNEDALIEELAGKYIAQAIINEYKEDANILDTIKKLIKKFLELFKISNLSDLQQIEKDIQSVSNELAKTVETNELLKFNTRDLPSNPELFQVSEDSSKGEKFTVYSNFPIHTSNLEKIGTEKRFSVRPKFHPTGYYKIQDAYYKITNVYDKQVNVSDIKNPKHIRDKSIGEDEIKYEHIKDFYDGRESMYVYQIQRLEGEIVNQLKEDEKTQKKGFSGQKHEAELVTISRLINVLKKRLVRLKEEGESEAKLQKAKDELSVLQTQLSVYKQDRDIEILESLANEALNRAEQFIRAVQQLEKTGKLSDKVTDVDFGFAREILERFTDKLSAGDKNRAAALWGELLELQDNHILEYVKKHDTSGKEINTEALNTEEQKQDIGSYKRWAGKLSTVTNKIGATIGSMINKAHDRVSAKNKETKHKIEAQIKALTEYQNSKGIQGKDIFNIFIQEANGTTVLTRPYTTAFYDLLASKEDSKDKLTVATYDKVNKRYVPHDLVKYTNQNYLTIQKEKSLRDFYNFHKELTKQLKEVLPTTVKEDFIANLRVDLYDQIKRGDKTVLKGLAGTFKNLIQVKEVRLGDFQAMEELKADMLDARKYQAKLSPEEKSRDLGQNLLAFAQFVNSYEELSDTLPKVRVLQSHLNETKNFIKSTGPGDRIDGKDTNLAALVEDTIKMQLLGQMKEEGVKIELEDSIDENGDPIKRYVSVSQIGDLMLKFNSLLRIGLNPMNAISNLSFGEVSNFIEASGGRFYTIKDMNNATAIFLKQTNNPDSVINRILEIVNPLQEIEDYENIESIKTKGQLSSDKIQDIMYTPQKMGEKFIQSRPMIAMMLKQGLLTKEGVLTKEGEEFLKDKEKVARFSTKVKGLNEKRHGRYSQRSAAALQQQLWFRVASQFKKWMSAAYEDRFESKYTDNDIGEDFEGRYITFKNTVLKEIRKGNIKNAFTNMFVPLFNSKKLLKENGGNLTELEVYNMRRNLTEAIILMSTVLIFNLLKGGDDDKERRKKPAVKFALEQLNRLAGDLELFYNPKAFNKTFLGAAIPLEKTINDIIKIGVDIPMLLFSDSDKLYYTSGEKKDELKILADITSATPILSPIVKTIRLFKKDVGYVSPNK